MRCRMELFGMRGGHIFAEMFMKSGRRGVPFIPILSFETKVIAYLLPEFPECRCHKIEAGVAPRCFC